MVSKTIAQSMNDSGIENEFSRLVMLCREYARNPGDLEKQPDLWAAVAALDVIRQNNYEAFTAMLRNGAVRNLGVRVGQSGDMVLFDAYSDVITHNNTGQIPYSALENQLNKLEQAVMDGRFKPKDNGIIEQKALNMLGNFSDELMGYESQIPVDVRYVALVARLQGIMDYVAEFNPVDENGAVLDVAPAPAPSGISDFEILGNDALSGLPEMELVPENEIREKQDYLRKSLDELDSAIFEYRFNDKSLRSLYSIAGPDFINVRESIADDDEREFLEYRLDKIMKFAEDYEKNRSNPENAEDGYVKFSIYNALKKKRESADTTKYLPVARPKNVFRRWAAAAAAAFVGGSLLGIDYFSNKKPELPAPEYTIYTAASDATNVLRQTPELIADTARTIEDAVMDAAERIHDVNAWIAELPKMPEIVLEPLSLDSIKYEPRELESLDLSLLDAPEIRLEKLSEKEQAYLDTGLEIPELELDFSKQIDMTASAYLGFEKTGN